MNIQPKNHSKKKPKKGIKQYTLKLIKFHPKDNERPRKTQQQQQPHSIE